MARKKKEKKKERSSAPKLGAQYQAVKLGVQIAGPPALAAFAAKDEKAALERVKSRNYQKGVFVSALDFWGSRKIRHAAALSRHSATALAPEIYATLGSAYDQDFDPANSYAEAQQRTSGYNPAADAFQLKDTAAQTYFLGKYGGWGLRKVLSATRLNEPINKFLSILGLTQ